MFGGVLMSAQLCASCSCNLHQGRTFTFNTPQGESDKCLNCSLRHLPMLRRCLLTALAVGTVLALINQGDKLLWGSWATAMYWKIPLTYCVPFLVTAWGALSNSRR